MTEILSCFYCGKPCNTYSYVDNSEYIVICKDACLSKTYSKKEEAIKVHNFISRAVQCAKEKEFKVGWVYENEAHEKWLILKIDYDRSFKYPIHAACLTSDGSSYFSEEGVYHDILESCKKYNLILSTGEKWVIGK